MNRDEKLRRLEGLLSRVVSRRELPRTAPEAPTSPAAAQPARPAAPMTSTQPAQPVVPVMPAQPVVPVMPAQPVVPVMPPVAATPPAAPTPPARPAVEVARVTPSGAEFDPDLAVTPPPMPRVSPPPLPPTGGLEIEHAALMGYSPLDELDTRERSSVQPARPSAELPTVPPPARDDDDTLLEHIPAHDPRKGPHPALSVLEEPPPRGSVVSIAPVEPAPRPSVVQLTPVEPPPRPSLLTPSLPPPASPEARPSLVSLDPFAPPARPSVVVAPPLEPPTRPSVVTMNPQEPPARPSLVVSANVPGARAIPQMPPVRNLTVQRYEAPEIPGFDSVVTVNEPPPLPANATLRTMLQRSLGLKLHSR